MSDYRRQIEDGRSRHERDWMERQDEGRSWFDDRNGRYEIDRGSGDYRSDDRAYHDRYRSQRWSAHNPEGWGVQHLRRQRRQRAVMGPSRARRLLAPPRNRPSFQGRGPKGISGRTIGSAKDLRLHD